MSVAAVSLTDQRVFFQTPEIVCSIALKTLVGSKRGKEEGDIFIVFKSRSANIKGQLILKCLFGVFTFFQKMNANKLTRSKVEIVRSFFGRNVGLKKSFQICLTFGHK